MSALPHPAPRHFESWGPLPGAGLPHDRLARLAARRVFVDLKDKFVQASAVIDSESGHWLREQVRCAEQPEDLLLLRGHLFAGLVGPDERRRETRRSLRRCIDSLFPDSAPSSGFAAF